MLKILAFSILICCQMPLPHAMSADNTDKLLIESRTAFYKDDFDSSIKLLEKYFSQLEKLPKRKAKGLFRFYAIAAVGRIYLQQKQDPVAAIEKFEGAVRLHR